MTSVSQIHHEHYLPVHQFWMLVIWQSLICLTFTPVLLLLSLMYYRYTITTNVISFSFVRRKVLHFFRISVKLQQKTCYSHACWVHGMKAHYCLHVQKATSRFCFYSKIFGIRATVINSSAMLSTRSPSPLSKKTRYATCCNINKTALNKVPQFVSTLCLKKTGPLLRFEITPTNCA